MRSGLTTLVLRHEPTSVIQLNLLPPCDAREHTREAGTKAICVTVRMPIRIDALATRKIDPISLVVGNRLFPIKPSRLPGGFNPIVPSGRCSERLSSRLRRGWTLRNAVRYGLAARAAAIMSPGTELFHREDVERLFESMSGRGDATSVQSEPTSAEFKAQQSSVTNRRGYLTRTTVHSAEWLIL